MCSFRGSSLSVTAIRANFPSVCGASSFQFHLPSRWVSTRRKGKTVQNLGLYLSTPCFSHGQLYVALSRVTSRSKFKALIEYPQLEEEDGVFTDNIVYSQIFQ
ncbi:hypothetical protein PC112_g23644 [Phytophthora cactorum]|nr:hypothetical protein PC112_g23644 [Phytophthora cactorum]